MRHIALLCVLMAGVAGFYSRSLPTPVPDPAPPAEPDPVCAVTAQFLSGPMIITDCVSWR